MSKKNLPAMCNDDIVVGEEIFRFMPSHEGFVIKHVGPGHGWKHFKKFSADQKDEALEEWRLIYSRRDQDKEAYSTGHSTAVRDISADLQKVEDSNFHRLEVPSAVETSVSAAVAWVEFSKKYAQVSVICAARAGAEFANIKEQCGRGEWMKVLKLLPFGKSTVYKYIKVAEELQARLIEESQTFNLLELPAPEDLMTGDYSETIDRINQVTGEQTLRQLYFDWGICKAPGGPTGGARKPKDLTPKELQQVRTESANDAVNALSTDLQHVCINEKRVIHYAEIEYLKLLEGDLIDALKNVKQLIKAG